MVKFGICKVKILFRKIFWRGSCFFCTYNWSFYLLVSHFSIWPGSLFYMSTVLPAIWVAELAILDEKIASGVETCELNAAKSDFSVGRGLVRIICSSKSTSL